MLFSDKCIYNSSALGLEQAWIPILNQREAERRAVVAYDMASSVMGHLMPPNRLATSLLRSVIKLFKLGRF